MNAGWDNLIPKEKKYTPQLAASAAKMLEDGKSLTLTARTHNVSRTTLRNWASTDPTLQRAFEVFEANKLGAELERERVGHFKNIARNIVENAKQGVPDPIGKALGKPAAPAQPEPPSVALVPAFPAGMPALGEPAQCRTPPAPGAVQPVGAAGVA